MNKSDNTNWGQSVAGIVIREDKILLVRHTYGAGKGSLIIPGGYVNHGETPQTALKREIMEETGIIVTPGDIIGIRFNMHDWYIVFKAEYVSGITRSDGAENSEAVWIALREVLSRDDVPSLTKKLVQSITNGSQKLQNTPYEGNTKHAPYSLYC